MADIRKVTFLPRDGGPYAGWLNMDRVLYAEDHGREGKIRCAVVQLDNQEMFIVDARALEARSGRYGRRS